MVNNIIQYLTLTVTIFAIICNINQVVCVPISATFHRKLEATSYLQLTQIRLAYT